MKSFIAFILYIFGVYCTKLSVEYQIGKNGTECDQKNILEFRLEKLIYLAVEDENCRKEAMELISWKYNFTEVYIEYIVYKVDVGVLHIQKISDH